MNKRQRKSCHPINRNLSQRFPASTKIDYRTDQSAVEEPEHRMVELVISDSPVVDIVGQADDKTVSERKRRNFNQWDRAASDQVAEQSDMQFKSRCCGVGRRLTAREQMANFLEQIKADAHERLSICGNFHGHGCLIAFVDETVSGRTFEGEAISIDRNLRVFI